MLSCFFLEIIPISITTIAICLAGLVLSLALEIIWIVLTRKNWWHSIYIDDRSLLGFRKYSFYIGIISCVVKLAFIVLLSISLCIFTRSGSSKYATPKVKNKN